MKKVLSFVLVLALVLSSMTFAFAAPAFEDIADTDYEEAINTLTALNVVTGYEDGTYRPERIVTRAEMAKLMVELLGYGDLVSGSRSSFADTQNHWADSWIALAAGRGIVIGYPDGTFNPDATVTYDEVYTMLVRGLGYTDSSNELKGMTWPTNFKVKAAELGITKDVDMSDSGADRGGVAQAMSNALEATLVTVDSDGNVVFYKDAENENQPLLSRLATKENIEKVLPRHLDEDHRDYWGDVIDLAPYMYQDIDVYVNDNDEVVYVAKVHSDVLVGELRRTDDDADGKYAEDGEVFIRIDGKNKAYDLFQEKDKDVSVPVYYNGVEISMDEKLMEIGDKDTVDLHKAAATFVLNEDDDIVGIIAEKYTEADKVTNEYNGRIRFQGFALPLDDDDEVDYDKLTVIGEVKELEDIEVDDIIVLFAGAGAKTPNADTEKLTILVVRDTVEGKITRTNSDGEFYIDGEYYAKSLYAKYPFEVGEEGIFFLDQKGDLVHFEEDDADEPKDYAVITELLNGVYSGGRVIADAEISIVNAKGEEVTYKFDSKAKVGDDYILDQKDDTDLDINGLEEYSVIKYTVNSRGRVSRITVVDDKVNVAEDKETDITGRSYELASNIVVFNYDDGDVEVVDADKLADDVIILSQEENKNGEIEMFFVKGLGVTSTYAYIVDYGTMWNDDDERVQSLVAYVDGVEEFYEAEAMGVIDGKYIDAATIVELEFDGDVVTGVGEVYTSTTASALVVGEIGRISGERFQVDGKWYTLDEDVAVYILDDGEFDEVGDEYSIYREAKVAGFAFDKDDKDDNLVKVLFIFE